MYFKYVFNYLSVFCHLYFAGKIKCSFVTKYFDGVYLEKCKYLRKITIVNDFAIVQSDVGNGNVQVRCTICYCYYLCY